MTGKEKETESPTDFNDCVSKAELHKLVEEQKTFMTEKFDEMMRHISGLVTRVEHLEQRPPPDDNEVDHDAERLRFNRRGMGGNGNGNNDPFAKTKFTMRSFASSTDPEAELAVEQKFNSHLVPIEHRGRLATSEFTSFALFWWNDLCTNHAANVPQTWTVLKQRMKSRFVPPYYQRGLRLKLQSLKQGDRGVEEYYQELIIGLARCGINELDEDISARFFVGLNRDIQDILDYKDWTRFSQLYHLALKAEREVQGRRQELQSFRTNTGRSFHQRSEVEKPKAPIAKSPATLPAPVPTSEVNHVSTVQSQPNKKQTIVEKGSSSSSANIICHRCKGMGHVAKDCPSRRAYIANSAGGYDSASDVEEEMALAINIAADSEAAEDTIISSAAAAGFPSLLVQHVLTSHEGHEENDQKIQRNNLFHMFFVVQGRRVLTIIDSGSWNNLVSSDLVQKLGLTTRELRHPYHIEWFNNSGKAKVTRYVRIHFSVGAYKDSAYFDVVPMQACSLLLGRPWEYDKDAAHHGRTNTITFMHENKNITLLPLSPADNRKHFKELAANAKNENAKKESESSDVIHKDIKLKGGAFLATSSATAELCDNHDAPCYTMLSQDVLVLDDTMSCMRPAVTNLLQEIVDGAIESRMTPIQ
ncbi:unnamed protein product [Urochloa humidicola]